MFQYIKEILTAISPGQRLVALAILLLSITLITVGPKIVNSFTQDTEELQNKINIQKSEILGLTTRVDELNRQVLDNQRECTNQWIAREREILDVVAMIEHEAASNHGKVIHSTSQVINRSRPTYYDENDTMPKVAMMIMPEPEVIKVTTQKVDNGKMLTMVKKLKTDIQKDLKNKQ